MKKMKLTAAIIFLTGFCGALHAAGQHGEHSVTPSAGDTAKDTVAEKKSEMKGGNKIKEQKVKAALQKYNCLLCHKYKGKGGTAGPAIDKHLRHHPKGELKKLLKEPKKPMPPFPGTEKELDEFLTTVIPAAAGSGAEGKPAVKHTLKTYVCPMGEFKSDKPGKCPKCGMTLVEKK